MQEFQKSHLYDLRSNITTGAHNIIVTSTELYGRKSVLPDMSTTFEALKAAIASVNENMSLFNIRNDGNNCLRYFSFISDSKHHSLDTHYGEAHQLNFNTTAIFLNLSTTTNLYKQLPLFELRLGHEEWHLKSGELTHSSLFSGYRVIQHTNEHLAEEFTVLINGEGIREDYAKYLKNRNLKASLEHPSDADKADAIIKGKYTENVARAIAAKAVKGKQYNFYTDAINAEKIVADSIRGK